MDDQDIFRELSFGLKFDVKRFQNDLKILKNDEGPKTFVEKGSKNALDFFKKKEKIPDDNPSRDSTSKIAGSEDMVQLRKMHKIFIDGTDIPDLITSFEQLQTDFGLPSSVVHSLKTSFKFDSPTPIQMQAITVMLHRRELLACAPTGSGKTLAFLIPLVAHCLCKSIGSMSNHRKSISKLRALIVSPTRELADQIFKVGRQLISSPDGESNQSAPVKLQILDKSTVKKFQVAGQKHANKYDIMVSTPNRLIFLLNHDPPLIDLSSVEWLVVDESDKLFETRESNGFRDQLALIYSSCTSKLIRRAMFSATFAFDVQQWCHLNMDSVIQINVGGKNTAVKTVDQKLLFTGNERGKLIALRDIIREGFKPPVLIFVQSKERAKELFAELLYDGVNVDVIHADRTPLQRENSVTASRTGKTWVLICTELMGRGIDFKGMNLVINYDFPTSAISYIHRVGRTGRAGRTGKAITFFTEDDRALLRSIANVIKEAGCPVPEYMLEMKKMNKDDKKKAARTEVKRDTIRSTPSVILEKGSKRKAEKGSHSNKKRKKKNGEQ